MKGPSLEALKAFPSFVYTRILWPIDIVLVDCHECYGRKILEWSMYIKIQYLDSVGITKKKKKIIIRSGNGLSISMNLHDLIWLTWQNTQEMLVNTKNVSNCSTSCTCYPLSEGLLNSERPDHDYLGRHLSEVLNGFWGGVIHR